MRPRTLLPLALAALLGAAVAVLPALAAGPSEVKLEVNENCSVPSWPCWTRSGGSPTYAHSVTIASGGTLMFADKTSVTTDVVWTAGSRTPVCTGVPNTPMGGWEGSCKFEQSGTYKFESANLWPEYRQYEIVVEGSAATTTSTTSTPSTPTSSPTPAGENPTGSPFSGAPAIHSSQRGTTVKGSLQIAKAGAGDRLEVDLIATTASLAKAGHATQVVGRFVSASVSAGQQSFFVKLDAKARKALKRHHHLALKVKITLTPAYGEATSVTRSVTLHA